MLAFCIIITIQSTKQPNWNKKPFDHTKNRVVHKNKNLIIKKLMKQNNSYDPKGRTPRKIIKTQRYPRRHQKAGHTTYATQDKKMFFFRYKRGKYGKSYQKKQNWWLGFDQQLVFNTSQLLLLFSFTPSSSSSMFKLFSVSVKEESSFCFLTVCTSFGGEKKTSNKVSKRKKV